MLQYFPNSDAPSLDGVQRWIQTQLDHWTEHGFGWWAVALQDDPEHHIAGWNGLQYLPETDEIEIGFLLWKSLWAQGLTTEAAQAGLRFGFESCKLTAIMAVTHPDNRASQWVLEKLGMTYTGRTEYFGMAVSRHVIEGSA